MEITFSAKMSGDVLALFSVLLLLTECVTEEIGECVGIRCDVVYYIKPYFVPTVRRN